MNLPFFDRRTLRKLSSAAGIILISFTMSYGQTKTLSVDSRFFIPRPPQGAVEQVGGLVQQWDLKDALLIAAMETVPQGVWMTSGTPSEVNATVKRRSGRRILREPYPCLCSITFPVATAGATRPAEQKTRRLSGVD